MGQFHPWTAIILKIFAVIFLLIAWAIGLNAHLGGGLGGHSIDSMKACSKSPGCPGAAVPLEIVFVTVLGILLIVSIVFLVLPFLNKEMISAECDARYCVVAGILLIICGAMMIAAAAMLRGRGGYGYGYVGGVFFVHKIVAGVMAFLSAILYFLAAYIICFG